MMWVVVSAVVWGQEWAKCGVLINMEVIHCLMTGSARDPLLVHLLRCLHFATATHQIGIVVKNTAADALSRNLMRAFLNATQPAQTQATQIPAPLLDMLLHQRPDWKSPNWRMFLSSLDRC